MIFTSRFSTTSNKVRHKQLHNISIHTTSPTSTTTSLHRDPPHLEETHFAVRSCPCIVAAFADNNLSTCGNMHRRFKPFFCSDGCVHRSTPNARWSMNVSRLLKLLRIRPRVLWTKNWFLIAQQLQLVLSSHSGGVQE